jgi:hypothetical protein
LVFRYQIRRVVGEILQQFLRLGGSVLGEIELRERQFSERSVVGIRVIGYVLIFGPRGIEFPGLEIYLRQRIFGHVGLGRPAMLSHDFCVSLYDGVLPGSLGGKALPPIGRGGAHGSILRGDGVAERLLAEILLGVSVIDDGRNDQDERDGCSADAHALLPVSGEEIECFFHPERDIILFQFLAGKMTGHENLRIGVNFHVNTPAVRGAFAPRGIW